MAQPIHDSNLRDHQIAILFKLVRSDQSDHAQLEEYVIVGVNLPVSPAAPSSSRQGRGGEFACVVIRIGRAGWKGVRSAEVINATLGQFGIRGCLSRMAQESGDHPEAAAERMRWVRSLLN
jgi:hypothetical protein